jgi:hypothetical protein
MSVGNGLTEALQKAQFSLSIKDLVLAMLATLTVSVYADTDVPIHSISERAQEIRITERIATLPIVMVREFPFVEGSIAGVKGKFMLDTGAESALSINDNRVPVSDARKMGRGLFGSGQTFDTRLVPELRDIRFGGLTYPLVTFVKSQDARLLEGITPDFIGWIGYNAFKTHAFKLDYRTLRATFYKYGEADYLEAERVVAELPFETRKLPNIPFMKGSVGDMAFVTLWDTGMHGIMYTSVEGKARLLREGLLTPSQTKIERPPDTCHPRDHCAHRAITSRCANRNNRNRLAYARLRYPAPVQDCMGL